MGYITCSKCGATGGTMVKVGDGKYAHQRESDCEWGRQRTAELWRQRKPANDLVIARPKIVLPKGGKV